MLLLVFTWAFSALPNKVYEAYDFVQKSPSKLSVVPEESDYSIVYFFNAACPCSNAHFQYLNDLKATYSKWNFIGFHSNKALDMKVAQAYFDNYTIHFPIYDDKNLDFANLLKANKTPHVYVIDKKGKVLYQGGATNSRDPERANQHFLKEILSALHQQKPLPYSSKKTLGCYIER